MSGKMRAITAQDLRDFFAKKERRRIMANSMLGDRIDWPSDRLVGLIVEEYIYEQETIFELDKSYRAMECVDALLDAFGLAYELDTFLAERYGDGHIVYDQESLMELWEEENERANVYP